MVPMKTWRPTPLLGDHAYRELLDERIVILEARVRELENAGDVLADARTRDIAACVATEGWRTVRRRVWRAVE